jgi:hypothetical protein
VPRLRAVIAAKDEQIASLTASLEMALAALNGEREQRRRLELRVAELERRLSMDSSDSGTPSSKERIGAKEARKARQQSASSSAASPVIAGTVAGTVSCLLSSVSPPRGPGQGNTTLTTCGSTAYRGCPAGQPRTARSSRRLPRLLPRSPSPSATHPTRAVSECHASCPATSVQSCGSSLPVGHIPQPERPSPLAPPALPGFTATTGRSASVPRDRYSAPHGFCRPGFSLSPPPLAAISKRHLHTFHTRASSGLMLPVRRTPPGQ